MAIYALGVDREEDIHAVPGPLGDLGRRDTGIQPSRYGRVAQVVLSAQLRIVTISSGGRDDFTWVWLFWRDLRRLWVGRRGGSGIGGLGVVLG